MYQASVAQESMLDFDARNDCSVHHPLQPTTSDDRNAFEVAANALHKLAIMTRRPVSKFEAVDREALASARLHGILRTGCPHAGLGFEEERKTSESF